MYTELVFSTRNLQKMIELYFTELRNEHTDQLSLLKELKSRGLELANRERIHEGAFSRWERIFMSKLHGNGNGDGAQPIVAGLTCDNQNVPILWFALEGHENGTRRPITEGPFHFPKGALVAIFAEEKPQ